MFNTELAAWAPSPVETENPQWFIPSVLKIYFRMDRMGDPVVRLLLCLSNDYKGSQKWKVLPAVLPLQLEEFQ